MKKSSTYVVGDIHGQYNALVDVLIKAKFKPKIDVLITLGDVIDKGPDSYKVVDFLTSMPANLISIRGNHDKWFLDLIEKNIIDGLWISQGGYETLKSYANELGFGLNKKLSRISTDMKIQDIPVKHIEFFKNQKLYYIDDENRCFVHGGFDVMKTFDVIEALNPDDFYWNREFWKSAFDQYNMSKLKDFFMIESFKEIYIGHTPTLIYNSKEPMNVFNIFNIDTGAGKKGGRLTLMNIDTKEFWQSDKIKIK